MTKSKEVWEKISSIYPTPPEGLCGQGPRWLKIDFIEDVIGPHVIRGPLLYPYKDTFHEATRHIVALLSDGKIIDLCRNCGSRVFENLDEYIEECITFLKQQE